MSWQAASGQIYKAVAIAFTIATAKRVPGALEGLIRDHDLIR